MDIPMPLKVSMAYSPEERAALILELLASDGYTALNEELRFRATRLYWKLSSREEADEYKRGELRGTAKGLLIPCTESFKKEMKARLEGEPNA